MNGAGVGDAVVESNKAFYEACARDYDRGREHFYELESRRIDRDLKGLAGDLGRRPEVVLDAGCGTGFFAQVAAQNGATKLHCLDIDAEFIRTTSARVNASHPEVELVEHQTDLGSFARADAATCAEVDLFVMGSVLQYVPDAPEVLGELVTAAPNSAFYITSTRAPAAGLRLVEDGMIAADYALHRLVRRPEKQTGLPGSKVTLEVDPQALEQIFRERGLYTRLRRYTSFHTALFTGAHRALSQVLPGLGTYFTLTAIPAGAAAVDDEE